MLPNHVVQQKMQEGSIVRIDTDIPVPTRDIVLVRSRLVPQSEGAARFTSCSLIVKAHAIRSYNNETHFMRIFRKCVFLYFRVLLSVLYYIVINLLNFII